MPCSVPSTTVSSGRRRRFPSSPPPASLAVLDLDKPTEREAHDFLRRFSPGPLATVALTRDASRWAHAAFSGRVAPRRARPA